MLFYYLFWMITGFIIHFYNIFRTNLLTGGLARNRCFLPVLGFQRKGISNGVQTEWNLRQRDFWEEYDPGDLEFKPGKVRGSQEIGGRAHTLEAPRTNFFRLYKSTYPKNIKHEDRSGVPSPQASVATKNQSGPCSGTLPEGNPSPVAIFIIQAFSMMRRD